MYALFFNISKNAAHGRKTITSGWISKQIQGFLRGDPGAVGPVPKKYPVRLLLIYSYRENSVSTKPWSQRTFGSPDRLG
jgi:hypothetical protein